MSGAKYKAAVLVLVVFSVAAGWSLGRHDRRRAGAPSSPVGAAAQALSRVPGLRVMALADADLNDGLYLVLGRRPAGPLKLSRNDAAESWRGVVMVTPVVAGIDIEELPAGPSGPLPWGNVVLYGDPDLLALLTAAP